MGAAPPSPTDTWGGWARRRRTVTTPRRGVVPAVVTLLLFSVLLQSYGVVELDRGGPAGSPLILVGLTAFWLALVVAWMPRARSSRHALVYGSVLYVLPGAAGVASGGPLSLIVTWPNIFVQVMVNCQLGLPCPVGE